MPVSARFFTPPQAAEVLGVTPDKVLLWIKSGELPASNLAANPNGERPRWRIAEDDLARFLFRRRHPVEAKPKGKPRKRRGADSNTTRYF
ncbi:helix-turn-helix domain-containing protein [Roseimaritima ulvae]|uniref:Helix-turn-helix domain protein n=1 Tax=Roseimaritima ulvae TaxID=980254 RepID=A0A5B9QTV5_9BACT|nr:helix-turn-helix domain-containing protein [Roseimaritima ulvae]QEG41342.1 Helix-turn-helix domain protein [Roseimaritima ulvae]